MNCKSCNSPALVSILDLGMQPPSNRYQYVKNKDQEGHPLELGICNTCGLLQLIDPMPIEMVRSRFSWITYNEPEFHLDDLVDALSKLPGINQQSKIVGLSYKDESTLKRFFKKGYTNIHNTSIPDKTSSSEVFDGLETIQYLITETTEISMNSDVDLMIVRHMLEHSHDMNKFLDKVIQNVNKDGYLVFEIPDSFKFLINKNYCFIWEEHIVYFTENTLRSFFERKNLEVVKIFRYQATLEDSLIVVVRNSDHKGDINNYEVENEILIANNFAADFEKVKNRNKYFLENAKNEGKKIAIFGAGHLATKYINMFGLKDFIYCIIDDSKDKEKLFLPGSLLPIQNSSLLNEIDICILALSPENQEKVMNSKKSLFKQTIAFFPPFETGLNHIKN
jgi:hypothetical protein